VTPHARPTHHARHKRSSVTPLDVDDRRLQASAPRAQEVYAGLRLDRGAVPIKPHAMTKSPTHVRVIRNSKGDPLGTYDHPSDRRGHRACDRRVRRLGAAHLRHRTRRAGPTGRRASSEPAMPTPACCWCCRRSTCSTCPADFSDGLEWVCGGVLLAGVLAQAGGFFLHLGVGQEGKPSPGTKLTRAGAALIGGRPRRPGRRVDPNGLSDATSNDAQPPKGAVSMWTNQLDQDRWATRRRG
jgi:hypothetical protein